MAQEFNDKLLDVLNGIHNELIVNNCLTRDEKINQRDVFDLEDNWNSLFRQLDNVEKELQLFAEKYCIAEEMSEKEFDELVKLKDPDLFHRNVRINKRIDQVQDKLLAYKRDGYVVRIPL
jgi:hypothetical protein